MEKEKKKQAPGYLLRLPEKLRTRLVEFCEDEERKMSEVIAASVRHYLDTYEQGKNNE